MELDSRFYPFIFLNLETSDDSFYMRETDF